MARILPVAALAIAAMLVVSTLAEPTLFHPRLRGGRVFNNAMDAQARRDAVTGFSRNSSVNWMDVTIDYAKPSLGTYRNRFYYDLSGWNGTGPAMVYISGEGPVGSSVGGFAQEYGYQIGAAMFTLEHRWYGDSLPGALTDKALLSSTLKIDYALRDIVEFMAYMEKTVLKKNVTWFSCGGSYSGGLSAWLKESYPDKIVAAWSSSGVVHPRFDYYMFDGHVKSVIPPTCTDAIKNMFQTFSARYDNPSTRAALLAQLNIPSYFTKTDIQWMLSDASATAVQYGMKSEMCNAIVPIGPDPMAQYYAMITDLWGAAFTSNCYYSTECLSNPSMSSQWGPAGYCWVFQCCSEVAWWQVGYPSSIRPENITTDYYIDQCREAYYNTSFPDIYAFNKRRGGVHPNAEYVIALQGSDDPWSTAGVQQSNGPLYPYVLAQCDGCGHCGDLMTPQDTDSESLQLQRDAIVSTLTPWIERAQAKRRNH